MFLVKVGLYVALSMVSPGALNSGQIDEVNIVNNGNGLIFLETFTNQNLFKDYEILSRHSKLRESGDLRGVDQIIPVITVEDAKIQSNYINKKKMVKEKEKQVEVEQTKQKEETQAHNEVKAIVVSENKIFNSKYSKADISLLAALLYAETHDIVNHDPRKEATVIVNRMEEQGKALEEIIMAGGGSQFNGVWSNNFKDRVFSDLEYKAAYDVLVNGYRSFESDILYFTNVDYVLANPDKCDTSFVKSIDWCYSQSKMNDHSYGRRFK